MSSYPHPIIAREGWLFVAIALVVALLLTVGQYWILAVLAWLAALFVLQFFPCWFCPDVTTIYNLLGDQRADLLIIAHHAENSFISQFFGIDHPSLLVGQPDEHLLDFKKQPGLLLEEQNHTFRRKRHKPFRFLLGTGLRFIHRMFCGTISILLLATVCLSLDSCNGKKQ